MLLKSNTNYLWQTLSHLTSRSCWPNSRSVVRAYRRQVSRVQVERSEVRAENTDGSGRYFLFVGSEQAWLIRDSEHRIWRLNKMRTVPETLHVSSVIMKCTLFQKVLFLLFVTVTYVNHTSAKKAGNSCCRWEAAARTEVTWLMSSCMRWVFSTNTPDQIGTSLSRFYGITSKVVTVFKLKNFEPNSTR